MGVFLIASCTVERLPAPPAVRTQEGNWTRAVADCPPLPTKGEDGSVALFVTKQGTPFRLCARLYNGLSSPLFVSSGMMRGAGPALQPVNVSARFQWWWFCDQLGARVVLPVAAGVR